tara:strand:+ start:3032 stop:3727 length:696 start_codon:yes stop_codon:yes gene_type:complete
MDRVIEPELMVSKEQVSSYSMADFSEGEENLMDFICKYVEREEISFTDQDLIIDLGCGPGNITERLSKRWPHANVLGIDGSKEMILKAISKKKMQVNKYSFRNLEYVCSDIKNFHLNYSLNFYKLRLIVSNSLIHHITHIDEFFDVITNLSSQDTINIHKDLVRPIDEKSAQQLKFDCQKKYNETLTKDYYASLKASYRTSELKQIILKKKFKNLDVIEDGEKYLIVYGSV